MVKLKDLKKDDNIAECDIFPEDSIENGHITVDIKSGELKEALLPKGYEWCENHIRHAVNNLIRLAKEGNLPSEYTVIWH